MYRVLSLFSGIGGLCELGIVAAGLQDQFQVAQFVENNEYCQKILAKHFPTIPIWEDIRAYNPEAGEFDIMCGGFPCQDISCAGKKAGIKEGTRSSLFFELIRIVRLVRPRYILLENVAGLLANGMGDVLKELSECGYDAEWSVVSAAEVGAVHKRERVFIIAYTQSSGWDSSRGEGTQSGTDVALIRSSTEDAVSYSDSNGCAIATSTDQGRQITLMGSTEFTNANNEGLETWQRESSEQETLGKLEQSPSGIDGETEVEPYIYRENDGFSRKLDGNLMTHQDLPQWLPRATDNFHIPYRKERLMALGNAVVPQVAAIAWTRLAQIIKTEK